MSDVRTIERVRKASIVAAGAFEYRCDVVADLSSRTGSLQLAYRGQTAVGGKHGISESSLCPICQSTRRKALNSTLTRHAMRALLTGRYAEIGGRTMIKRTKHLVAIAAAYSREELLMEPGIGPATATRIELWLEERGTSLRPTDE